MELTRQKQTNFVNKQAFRKTDHDSCLYSITVPYEIDSLAQTRAEVDECTLFNKISKIKERVKADANSIQMTCIVMNYTFLQNTESTEITELNLLLL